MKEPKFLNSTDYNKIIKEIKTEIENPIGYFKDVYLQNKDRNPDFLNLFLHKILQLENEIKYDWINFCELNPQYKFEDIEKRNPEYSLYQQLKRVIIQLETPEPDKEQPQPKQPKGKPILTREQTAVLFFYLRELRLIAQPQNKELATAINLISGYSNKQIYDILRKPETPIYQLGSEGKGLKREDLKILISMLEILKNKIETDLKTGNETNEFK